MKYIYIREKETERERRHPNNPFSNLFNIPFRFTRIPKSTDTCVSCGEQGHWRRLSESLATQQNRLNQKVKFYIILSIPV